MKRHAALLALLFAAAAAPAQAYIFYSCRGPDGQRVYNDAGCGLVPEPVPEEAPPEEAEAETDSAPAAVPVAAVAAPAPQAHGAVLESAPVPPPQPPPAPVARPPRRTPAAAVTGVPLPPEPEQSSPRPARRTALLLSAALVLLSWIWLARRAFGIGTLWGWCTLLLPPSVVVLGLRHPRPAGPGLGLMVAGAALAGVLYVRPIDQIMVADSHLTDVPGTRIAVANKPRQRFSLSDTVYYKTSLDWDDPWLRGTHTVRWVWISGRQPPVESKLPVRFRQSPLTLQGWMRGAELGRGPHAVQVYVDDRLLDQRRFEVRR